MRKIIKLFEDGNVCVYGLRGRGKDLLMSNVAVRRKLPYVCNVDYGGLHNEFHPDDFNCGYNSYKNFIDECLNKYVYPFPDGTDVYISDAGIYFPAQYCNELNRDYKYFPTFFGLSRHVGKANVHTNAQNLARIWDKIREQSDTYILCNWSKVLFGRFVIQHVTLYDKYDSALNKMLPFSVTPPLFASRDAITNLRIQKQMYECKHGHIKHRLLFYIHKSNYNDRHFKEVLKNGI